MIGVDIKVILRTLIFVTAESAREARKTNTFFLRTKRGLRRRGRSHDGIKGHFDLLEHRNGLRRVLKICMLMS